MNKSIEGMIEAFFVDCALYRKYSSFARSLSDEEILSEYFEQFHRMVVTLGLYERLRAFEEELRK